MKEKKIILIIIILCITLLSFIIGLKTKSNDVDNENINTNNKLKEEHNFENVIINDFTLVKDNNYTNLSFTITNNSESSFSNYSLKIHFYDKNNKEKDSIIIDIGTLEKNEKKIYAEQLSIDCIDSYDFSFEKVNN